MDKDRHAVPFCLPGTPKDILRGGFTLIEAVIVVAMAVIIFTAVIPAWAGWALRQRLDTEVYALLADLHLARSEAIRRARRTVLCPSHDGEQCRSDPEWHRGWIVFADDNGNRRRDPNELVLRVHAAAAKGITITSNAHRLRLVYQASGLAPGTNMTFTFCAPHALPQAVILSNAGRPRQSDTRPGGGPLSCPGV